MRKSPTHCATYCVELKTYLTSAETSYEIRADFLKTAHNGDKYLALIDRQLLKYWRNLVRNVIVHFNTSDHRNIDDLGVDEAAKKYLERCAENNRK
jgi:hypothetical protein